MENSSMTAESTKRLPEGSESVKNRLDNALGVQPECSTSAYCDRCRSDRPHIGAVRRGEAGKWVRFDTAIDIVLKVDGCHVGSPSTMRSYTANTPRGRANLYGAKRKRKGKGKKGEGRILLDACLTHVWALANAGVDVQWLLENIALYDELQAAQARCTPESLRRLRCDIDAFVRQSETMVRAAWNGGADERETVLQLHRAHRALDVRMERVYETFFFDPARGAFFVPKGRLDRKKRGATKMRRTGTDG
jgi:hypothetical protein